MCPLRLSRRRLPFSLCQSIGNAGDNLPAFPKVSHALGLSPAFNKSLLLLAMLLRVGSNHGCGASLFDPVVSAQHTGLPICGASECIGS